MNRLNRKLLLSVFLLCWAQAYISLAWPASLDTQLGKAVQANNIGFIQQQLQAGLGVDHRLNSETLLMIAARGGRFEIVKLLIAQGADVNAKSSQGHSALSFSARYGHLEIVQYLLNHGAEVNISNNNNWTPLLKAARGGHLEVVDYLLAHEADINNRNSAGLDAIALAHRYGHKKVEAYLKHYKRTYK